MPVDEDAWRSAVLAAKPAGLQVFCTWPERPPRGPAVVLVHGSLDRGTSFSRTLHRLDDLAVLTYDRRGYQGSRGLDPSGFETQVDDLLALAASADTGNGVVAVGHSFGGVIVQGAALRDPKAFCAIGAYEPPMPWLGFFRAGANAWPELGDPGDEAEQFFRRMVGDQAWERLPQGVREDRRADGPALVDDLAAIRSLDFDPAQLRTPIVYGCGGEATAAHHRESVAHLGEVVPGASVVLISDAGHGAHLSHPDAFAALVRTVIEIGERDV